MTTRSTTNPEIPNPSAFRGHLPLAEQITQAVAERLAERLAEAERRLDAVREYAAFLSRLAGQRPEVNAFDVSWKLRSLTDPTEPEENDQ